MNPKSQIFISYSSQDIKIVNEIDNDFYQFGIKLLRDVRDVEFRDSFKKFMSKIRETDFVLMVITRNFLTSKYCLYEVLEFIKDNNYKDKILPIVSNNLNFSDSLQIAEYVKYWKTRYETLANGIKDLEPDEITFASKELKELREIRINIAEFLSAISDIKYLKIEDLPTEGYKSLFKILKIEGIDYYWVLSQLFDLVDVEQREVKINDFVKEHPTNAYCYYWKGKLETEKGYYTNAITCFQNTVKIMPDYTDAHSRLAKLYYLYLGNYNLAAHHFEISIKLDPTNRNRESFILYAKLILSHFPKLGIKRKYLEIDMSDSYGSRSTEETEAKYFETIRVRPPYNLTEVNILLRNIRNYIETNPRNSHLYKIALSIINFIKTALNNNDIIDDELLERVYTDATRIYKNRRQIEDDDLTNNLDSYKYSDKNFMIKESIKYLLEFNEKGESFYSKNYNYQKSIKDNPTDSSKYNLYANFLYKHNHFFQAKKYFEKSIFFNPIDADARMKIAFLEFDTFKNIKSSLKHYKKLLDCNTDKSLIHYNLAVIYFFYIKNDKQALNHLKLSENELINSGKTNNVNLFELQNSITPALIKQFNIPPFFQLQEQKNKMSAEFDKEPFSFKDLDPGTTNTFIPLVLNNLKSKNDVKIETGFKGNPNLGSIIFGNPMDRGFQMKIGRQSFELSLLCTLYGYVNEHYCRDYVKAIQYYYFACQYCVSNVVSNYLIGNIFENIFKEYASAEQYYKTIIKLISKTFYGGTGAGMNYELQKFQKYWEVNNFLKLPLNLDLSEFSIKKRITGLKYKK